MKNTKRGFTIVELVIVIAVIAILAAILIPVFSNVVASANEKSRQAEIKNAFTAYTAEEAMDGVATTDQIGDFTYKNADGEYYSWDGKAASAPAGASAGTYNGWELIKTAA